MLTLFVMWGLRDDLKKGQGSKREVPGHVRHVNRDLIELDRGYGVPAYQSGRIQNDRCEEQAVYQG